MSGRFRRSAEIINQRGLHARASAAFAREALKHDAKVIVNFDDMTASAASIIDLLMLGARIGHTVEIETEGREAEQALGALCELIARKFDEKD
ncbi:MAG: HPr family phosphocarrier protein [Alphaproteobacteria bacterium]|nr:HPr family phosphocarrier protein [Alphaproteobacteria bacterium]